VKWLAGALALAVGSTVGAKEAPDDAPGAQRIGLRDALKMAVRQNPTLASETIDVAIAEAQIRETYGIDEWLVDASANWESHREEPVRGQGQQITSRDNFSVGAGVTKPLSTGGRVGARLSGNYNRSTLFIDFGGFTGEQKFEVWTPAVSVTFFQPLLRGFGSENRYAGREQARAERTVQELERENSASSVVRDVVSAYWELAYAAAEVQIRRQSLALAQEQLRVTKANVDAGRVARTELAAAEQVIAEREELVMLAEQAVSDRSIELRALVGMEIGPDAIDLVAADRLDTDMPLPDLNKVLTAAYDNNPQLKAVRAQQKRASIEVEVTENGVLPQLDFNAAITPSGYSDTPGDAFQQVGTFDSYTVSAGLTFSYNVGDSGARGRLDAARGRLRKVKMTETEITSQIATAVVRTVNVLRVAKKRLETAQKGSKLALINIDAEKVRWEQGRATNFDVLKRQDELAQAQLREARARADYLKAMAQLDALTGAILERYGIQLTAP
jgi:outer membrane protein TolC